MVEQTTIPPTPEQQAIELLAQLEVDLPARLLDAAGQVILPDLASRARSRDDLADRFDDRFSELLELIYAERGQAPIFVVDRVFTPTGQAVFDTLSSAWDHALIPNDYGADLAAEHLRRLGDSQDLLSDSTGPSLSEDERQSLVAYLTSHPEVLALEGEALLEAVESAVTDLPRDESPAPDFRQQVLDYSAALVTRDDSSAALELILAAGFLRYAYDMRYFNPAWYTEEVVGEENENIDSASRDAMISAYFDLATSVVPQAQLDGLPPHYPQYPLLVEAHRRYRELAVQGWPTVEHRERRNGRSYDDIPALRERLQIEGYFSGDITGDEYNREVRNAIEAYQLTHQLRDNGRLTEETVESLNVAPLRRARQLAVAIQRWRESQLGNDSYYVHANISDFHAEIWRDGVRDLRFRTIVGSTQRFTREETGEVVYPRATPELHRPLRYIVFNPYWNVPQGIMINEYDHHLRENPFWYEDNGYEVLYSDNGTRRVRMLPGDDNALGVVKFLFPNSHDVYMHDTPGRHLFNRTFRAFSHGCVRVDEPVGMAEYLLANDRGWDVERVAENFGEEEQWVSLRSPIMVHIEYMVARIDDDGNANFLADLYRRDRPRMRAQAEAELDWIQQVASTTIGLSAAQAAEVDPPSPLADATESAAIPAPDAAELGL